VEHSGYPATPMSPSHSVAARLSADTQVTSHRRGSSDSTSSQHSHSGGISMTPCSVVTHVDPSGSNPVSSLAGGDIPLGRVPPPHATPGECFSS